MTKKEQLGIFKNWMQQHRALFFKVVSAYTHSSGDREDLFQDISVQVWHSIPNFKNKSAVTTWLYRVSLNTAIKWIRKERRHSEGRESIEQAGNLLIENEEPQDERLVWMYNEIYNLNEIDRSLALLMLDGFNYKEMAEMTGLSETNVGVRVHRIKKHLMTKSKKYDYHGIR